jgi:hypothetical protein
VAVSKRYQDAERVAGPGAISQVRSEGVHAGHELFSGVHEGERKLVAIRHPKERFDRKCPLFKLLALYEDLHGEACREVAHVEVSPVPRGLFGLGELLGVIYRRPNGKRFIHEFDDPPLLAASDDKRLHVVGGTYTVTRDGIEG